MIRSYKYHKMFCNEIAAVRREDLLFSAQASLRFVQLDRTSAVRKSMISMCLLLELDFVRSARYRQFLSNDRFSSLCSFIFLSAMIVTKYSMYQFDMQRYWAEWSGHFPTLSQSCPVCVTSLLICDRC